MAKADGAVSLVPSRLFSKHWQAIINDHAVQDKLFTAVLANQSLMSDNRDYVLSG